MKAHRFYNFTIYSILNVHVFRLDVTMRNLQPSGAGNLGVIFNVRDKGQYDYAYVRYG